MLNIENEFTKTVEKTEKKVEENQSPVSADKQKTFTQEELNKAISARLSQQKEKHEKILAEKLLEIEKLAKMDAQQKAEYEKRLLEKRLEERENAIARRELMAEAKEQLSQKGLPAELIECLDLSNSDKYSKSFNAVENAFAASVEKKVNNKLRQSPPTIGAIISRGKDPFITGMGL